MFAIVKITRQSLHRVELGGGRALSGRDLWAGARVRGACECRRWEWHLVSVERWSWWCRAWWWGARWGGGGGGGEVEEGLVATTWELSQPQGPSQMVVAGANASRKIEFKLEEVPLNSFSGMCLISNSLKRLSHSKVLRRSVCTKGILWFTAKGGQGVKRGVS